MHSGSAGCDGRFFVSARKQRDQAAPRRRGPRSARRRRSGGRGSKSGSRAPASEQAYDGEHGADHLGRDTGARARGAGVRVSRRSRRPLAAGGSLHRGRRPRGCTGPASRRQGQDPRAVGRAQNGGDGRRETSSRPPRFAEPPRSATSPRPRSNGCSPSTSPGHAYNSRPKCYGRRRLTRRCSRWVAPGGCSAASMRSSRCSCATSRPEPVVDVVQGSPGHVPAFAPRT